MFNLVFYDSLLPMTINSKQRSILRSIGQNIDPVVMVGKDKLKDNVVNQLDEALHVHEIVKVKFVAHKDEVEEMARTLEKETASFLVAVTGFTALYFRQDEKDKSKRIYNI